MTTPKRLRRSNGEGSFYQSNGIWHGQFALTKGAKLLRRSFSGETKLEVYKKGQQWLEAAQLNTTNFSSHKTNLEQLCNYWLNEVKRVSVRPKTFQKYVSTLNIYIIPYLGKYKISAITPQNIQEILNQWSDGTLLGKKGHKISSSTVRTARRYLSELFEYAFNIGLVLRNPVRLTKPPKLIIKEIHPLTITEIHQLTEAMKDQYLSQQTSPYEMVYYASYIAVKLALGTGMRLGEVFGLCWDCVDLNRALISVIRTVQTGSSEQTFHDTKTKTSRRSIPISQELRKDLEIYKKYQSEYAILLGDKWSDDNNALITGSCGKILSTSNFKSRYFIPVLKNLGLEHITFHDLRHTHATLLLSQKINPKIVQERLGHSTITLTLDTYSHLVPDIQKEAVKALDKLGI